MCRWAWRCNEAVELSKKFGGDGSPAFVNGVLGKIGKDGEGGIEKPDNKKEEKTAEAEMETEKAETEAAE